MARDEGREPVRFDGDAKLQAFLGALAFLLAALFWGFVALRLAVEGRAVWPGAAIACALSVALFFLAWGLRVSMEAQRPVTRWDVRRLLLAGLVLGVGLGALPYLILRFKLEDPDFIHLASKSENLPPVFR